MWVTSISPIFYQIFAGRCGHRPLQIKWFNFFDMKSYLNVCLREAKFLPYGIILFFVSEFRMITRLYANKIYKL